MLTIIDQNDLLTALYDGPFDQPLWSTFLERLRARLNATYAGIVFRPPDRPEGSRIIELSAGERPSPEFSARYRERLYKADPFPTLPMRDGRVYSLPELLSPDNPEHAAFLRDMLEPSGFRFMRMVRVTEPGGISAWLNVARSKSDFTAADSALLDRLALHFRRSLRNHVALERERLHASVADAVLQRLDFGWITLDATGCVVETSPQAQRILQHDCGLRIARNGRLTATRAALDKRLTETMRDLATGASERPRAINVSRDPWVDMLLAPIVHRMESTGRTAVMTAYLQGDNQSIEGRHEQIAELFGLLPSEARLALALSRGLSIAEAAESLGLTIETARNYSKKIYAKMGARGQPDLIRFILTSVLALA